MRATIRKLTRGKWEVKVGRWVISDKESHRDALILKRQLARPGTNLDYTSDDIDLFPDRDDNGKLKNPYPVE
jgi:hypothetical protein